MAIVGYEVDSEEAFERMIDEFGEAFTLALQSQWNLIASSVSALASAIAVSAGLTPWVTAIGAAVTLASNVFFALWAPADLIIEDTAAGSDVLKLGELTSLNFPLPSVRMLTSPNDIKVIVEPVDKVAFQYRERRRYRSDSEDSTYEIVLTYNQF